MLEYIHAVVLHEEARMSQEFVDTYDAAEELRVSRPTLYRLLDQFEIKKYKLPGNRRTLIRRVDLDRLLQPQEREGKLIAAA